MKNYLPLAGWTLALVFSISAYTQYRHLQDVTVALEKEKQTVFELSRKMAEDREQWDHELADLRRRLIDARQDLALARNNLQETQDEISGDEPEFLVNESAMNGSGRRQGMFGNMMNNPRFQELSAKMQISNRFGPFINSLGLSPEERDELNSILMEVINEQQSLQQQMMNGELTMEDFQAAMADLDMNQALASFLTEDEMEQWYDWQDQETERAQQQAQMAMNMQLTMQTPGLTQDNRSRLAELLTNQNNFIRGNIATRGRGGAIVAITGADIAVDTQEGSNNIQEQIFSSQRQRYDEIRQELKGTMDEDQMAIVNSYLEQQELQMEMVQEMMSVRNSEEGPQGRGFFISQ